MNRFLFLLSLIFFSSLGFSSEYPATASSVSFSLVRNDITYTGSTPASVCDDRPFSISSSFYPKSVFSNGSYVCELRWVSSDDLVSIIPIISVDSSYSCNDGDILNGTVCIHTDLLVCPDGSTAVTLAECPVSLPLGVSLREIPALYYIQSKQGTTLRTKINTVSGIPLSIAFHDSAFNPYVGLYWEPVDGSLYYSYQVQLDVGEGVTVPVTYKTKISYDSLGDLIVYFALNPAAYAQNYFQFLTDFFLTPAEANPYLISSIVAIVIEAASLMIQNGVFSELGTGSSGAIDVPIDGLLCGGFNTPQEVCDNYGSPSRFPGNFSGGNGTTLYFSCLYSSDSSLHGGGSCHPDYKSTKCVSPGVWNSTFSQCSGSGTTSTPVTPGYASNKIATMFKNNMTHPTPAGGGRIGKAIDIGMSVVDLAKNIYDAYQRQHGANPSATKPGGGVKMPDDKPHYSKDWPDKPDADIEPPDLSKDAKTEAPTEKDLGTKTETKPDGSQTKTEEKLDIKNGGGGEIITEIISRIIEIGAGGEIISETTTSSTPTSSTPATDYCKEHPDIIACSKWGEPEEPDPIPEHEMDVTIDPGSSSPGSCPADKVLHLSFGDGAFSYEPICQVAGYINPIMIALAWLTAGFVLFGAVKE